MGRRRRRRRRPSVRPSVRPSTMTGCDGHTKRLGERGGREGSALLKTASSTLPTSTDSRSASSSSSTARPPRHLRTNRPTDRPTRCENTPGVPFPLPTTTLAGQFDSIRAPHHLARVRKSHLRPHKYRSSRRVRYNIQIYSIYPIYPPISAPTCCSCP